MNEAIYSFFSNTGFIGVLLVGLTLGLGVLGLVLWQVKRQGWARVLKSYGLLLTLLLGIHLFTNTNTDIKSVPLEANNPTAPSTEARPAPVQVADSKADKVLDVIEERLTKRPKAREPQIEAQEISFASSGRTDPTLENLKPYLIGLFVLAILLYLRRAHPEKLQARKVFRIIGLGSRWIRPERSTENELGSSDFATAKELKPWLKRDGKYDTVLPVSDLRGSGGILVKNGDLVIPIGQRNRHILIIAKTGSGKTTKLILPIVYADCLCRHRSTIIIDSKAEMWSKCAAMTKERNPDKQLILFNPLDKYRSLSWNILSKIETDTDCKLIANSVIMATDEPQAKQDSPFFRNSALQVLNAMMVGLLNDADERLSMPRIHELLNLGMLKLCDWLEAHPHAIRTTRSFVELARSGSQNADTIMSELSMRIQAWDLKTIRGTTFFDDIDIESIVREPSLFIVELRESELKMLRPLANVIVVELLRYLTKFAEECPGQSLPRPVGLIVDEFASALGRLPDIHIKLNTLRSRNVSIVAAIQSIGQLKGNYGEDWESVLSGFSTKIFMPSLDYMDSEWASKESGTMTVRYRTSTKGANRKITENFAHRNTGINEQIQQRQVLTPGEVGRPADNQQTFFLPETPVFQGHLTPFYKIPEMLKFFTALSGPEHEVKLRDEPIEIDEVLPEAIIRDENGNVAGAESKGAAAAADDLSDEQLWQALEELKIKELDWENTIGDARRWWELFEEENKHRIALVLKIGQEIAKREATITDFFLAHVYSNTSDIHATLAYLDYTIHMKAAEANKA